MAFQIELHKWKNKYGSKLAVCQMDGVAKSYTELYDDIMKYANIFSNLTYDRIAIMGGTSYNWLCHVYGALIAGKTVIAIDPLLPINDVITLLKNSDSETVFADEEDVKLRKAIEDENITYSLFYGDIQLEDSCFCGNNPDGDIIFFTSGTSGNAKGVVLPFEAVYGNAQRLSESVAVGMEGNMYTPLPLYHIYANTMTIAFWHKGQTVCLGSPRRIINDLEHFKPPIIVVVSAMAEFLLKNNVVGDWTKLFAVAGAKCEKELELKAAEYGIAVQNLYGASETAGGIGLSKLGNGIEKMVPAKGVEVLVADDGEIVISTLGHMREYYNNPEATREVIRDGRIYLGDMGKSYGDGSFSPLGRKQDVIAMSNGNKLYCDEMDAELTAIDGVEEACVIYKCDKIMAIVVCQNDIDESIVKKNIKMYNKKQPYYRKIDKICISKQPLPRTAIGKLKRNMVLNSIDE